MYKEFESKLNGKFDGWNGNTIYQLKNGTKWRLIENKNSYQSSFSPKAFVWREGEEYYLEIVGAGTKEKVRRVE